MKRADYLVPLPVRVEATGESFALNAATHIEADGAADVRRVADMLSAWLRAATGYAVPVKAASGKANCIRLTLSGADATLGDEGYELVSDRSGVTICATKAAGLYYGCQTLRQLLPPQAENIVPAKSVRWTVEGARIWDSPRFQYRGLMLDSSRHIQSMEYIKRLLDRMAYHKLNTLHWHLTDDQGWRIEIKKYPKLTEVGGWRNGEAGKPYPKGKTYGGYYTQDQLKEIVRYAADRFITVIPEVDVPGHMVAAVAAYPEYACTAGPFEVRQSWGISEDVLCAGNEAVYRFVEDVLLEVMDIFPSKVIHIGGDECPRDRWKECPKCQAAIKAHGLKDEDALQMYFTRRVTEFLRSHGRRLQGWNEIMAGGDLPNDVIVHQWNWPNAGKDAAVAGNDVVNSMYTWCYFDFDYFALPLRKVYGCDPEPEGLTPEQRKHILGAQANLWTEHRPTESACDDYLWPRTVAFSEVVWSPQARRDLDDFLRRAEGAHYDRLARMGLAAAGSGQVAIKRRLVERTHIYLGEVLGEWRTEDVAETPKTMEWDITKAITGAGDYVVTFQWLEGWHGFEVRNLCLLCDGVEVARDPHVGFAGTSSRNNAFTLRLKEAKDGGAYVLRVTCRTDGGTNSRGRVWVRK